MRRTVAGSAVSIDDGQGQDRFEDYDDYYDDCANCGGDGFVAHCFTEYACMYPDEGCSLCMRRCEFCQPLTAAEIAERDKLRDILATALAKDKSAGMLGSSSARSTATVAQSVDAEQEISGAA